MKHLEGNLQPEQIERIKKMEQRLDRASLAVKKLGKALQQYEYKA